MKIKRGQADGRSKNVPFVPVYALDYDYIEVHEWLSPQFQLLVYGLIGTVTNVAVIASLTSENNIALVIRCAAWVVGMKWPCTSTLVS